MKDKIRSLFLFYFLTLTWAILGIAVLGPLTVVEAQTEETATTEVPDLVDMSQADAQSEIMEAGLILGTLTQASSEEVSPGNVMAQNPVAETSVSPGTFIDLIISAGPATYIVPNVVGMAQKDAQAAITSAQLTVGLITPMNSSTIPAGSIIGQNPKSKTALTQGSAVNLILSSGP